MERIPYTSSGSSLIALITFPVVLAAYLFFRNNEPETMSCVNILFPSKGKKDDPFQLFHEYMLADEHIHYTTYRLTGNVQLNKSVMNQLRRELPAFARQHRTTEGIHIRIDDNAPFQAYISCFNIYNENRPAVFFSVRNDIYILFPKTCGGIRSY